MLLKKISYLVFIAFAVTITYFMGDGGKNILLIGVISITPFLLLFTKGRFDRLDFTFLLFIIVLFFVYMMHPNSFRPMSYLYTLCFVTSFLFLRKSINIGYFDLDTVIKVIRNLIYAYCIVLLIQQGCVLFGVPVINQGVSYIDQPWKLCSLSPEPSHLVRFVFFLMYAFIELREVQMNNYYTKYSAKVDRCVWLCFFWIMTTCVSTTGFVLLFLIFSKFINKRTLLKFSVLGVIVFFLLSIALSSNETFGRIPKLVGALFTFDFDVINEIDHSAADRFLSFFMLFDHFDIFSEAFWIGEGMDVGKHIGQELMVASSNDISYIETDQNVGGIVGFFIDAGILPFSLLIAGLQMFFKFIKNKLLVAIWYFFAFFSGINMQMFWLSLILLYMVYYFSNEHKRKEYNIYLHRSNPYYSYEESNNIRNV